MIGSFIEVVTHITSRIDRDESILPIWLRVILEFAVICLMFSAFVMLLVITE